MFVAKAGQQDLNSFSFRSMGPKHAPQGHMYIFSSHFGALEHVFVVRIWIMDIKCLENSINE